jgi:N-acetylglucosaminyldiphosphoundecaprenol N-acetyl-beta-D-mannosaminyltransferase
MLNSDFSQAYANVLGVNVSAIDLQSAVTFADEWISSVRGHGYICATGVHGVMDAHADPEFRQILNQSFINAPDGMPMVWVGRLLGFRSMERVFGPDLMLAMCQLSVERGYRNFLYGGKPGVAERLSANLQKRFPGLQVVGTYTPPFRSLTPDEEKSVSFRILKSRPHILWVGLGTPKQERFMAQYVDRFQVPLMVGVGAAFDYHTGSIRDCSVWVKRAGMQWLHRLLQDPKRLWRRYLRNNPAFLWHITCQLTRLRRYPAGRESSSQGARIVERLP